MELGSHSTWQGRNDVYEGGGRKGLIKLKLSVSAERFGGGRG